MPEPRPPKDDPDLGRLRAWFDVLEDANYYELLGVLQIADDQSIKQAFHDFALAFHPDGHLHRPPELISTARRIFQRGVEAYRTLNDATLRAQYDLALAKGALRLDPEAGKMGQEFHAKAAEAKEAGPKSPKAVRSLDELCRTPAARLCAHRADQLISVGDLRGAKRELQMAAYHDGGENSELAERLDALDVALFAMGQ